MTDDNIIDVTPGKEKPAHLTKGDVEKDYEYTRGNYILLLKKVRKQLMVF